MTLNLAKDCGAVPTTAFTAALIAITRCWKVSKTSSSTANS
ncbi:hypothetical protein AHiyo8_26390 [Arthrobacter sp. Hiyo8]|nr:hypothetical protein AHiyo8_26390 [Arthrobacter sp. Hiyo8]